MTIAPKSSIMANIIRNILSEIGTRLPKSDRIPNDKATYLNVMSQFEPQQEYAKKNRKTAT